MLFECAATAAIAAQLKQKLSIVDRVPATHPLRRVRALLDKALDSMSRDFDRRTPKAGVSRWSRSGWCGRWYRRCCTRSAPSGSCILYEQLDYNLLFRRFVGLSMDDRICDHSTFTKNRDRLIEAGMARELLRRIGRRARREGLLSSKHFRGGAMADDPFSPGRNPHVDFHGERRTNETQAAPHELQAKLFRKPPSSTTWDTC